MVEEEEDDDDDDDGADGDGDSTSSSTLLTELLHMCVYIYLIRCQVMI